MTIPRPRRKRSNLPPAVVHLKSADSWLQAACGELRRRGHLVIGASASEPHVVRGSVCPACLAGERYPKVEPTATT